MSPRLYDICCMVFHKVEKGCIYGVWIVPKRLVEDLQFIFKHGTLSDFLVENKFLKIVIDFQVVYSYEGKQRKAIIIVDMHVAKQSYIIIFKAKLAFL